MRGYGLPREHGVNWPDKGDIREFGRKSSVGQVSGRSGDCRGSFKNKAAKAATRRTFARRARASGHAECRQTD